MDYDSGTDSQVVKSTITFADAVLNNRPLPQYSWTVGQDGAIDVTADTRPTQVLLWQATNPVARDFRLDFTPGVIWTSQPLSIVGPNEYIGNVPMPATGATAYFIQLTFENKTQSLNPYLTNPYVFTTEIRVKSTLPLTPWPFDSGLDVGSTSSATPAVALLPDDAATSGADGTLTAAACAVALESDDFDASTEAAVETIPTVAAAARTAAVTAPSMLLEATPSDFDNSEATDTALTDDFADLALDELLV